MKTIIKQIILTSACLFASCSFLEVEERGKSDTDSFFKEMDGLRTAMVGTYRATYDFYNQYLYKYAEVAGDGLQAAVVGSGNEMNYEYNFLAMPEYETSAVGYLWKRGYAVITNSNTILSYTEDLKKSFPREVAEIQKIEAQVHFLRALVHFDLVRCYAQPYAFTADASHIGIPIATRVMGTDEKIARSSVSAVYTQVIKDLNHALTILGNDAPTNAIYTSGMACNALLARVYLYMGNDNLAEQYANMVIPALPLTTRENYAAMFTGEQLGAEAIFRLSGYYAGSQLKTFYNYDTPAYLPTDEIVAIYDAGDIRSTLLLSPTNKQACMKYYSLTESAPDRQFYHLTVLRGSEMYLIRAEARCRQNDLQNAADDIKTLEARALGIPKESINLLYSNKDNLMKEIKRQRIKELSFEGHRFFDLARWGDDIVRPANTNSSMKKLTYPNYRYALPIPFVEMESNSAMVQNDGYK